MHESQDLRESLGNSKLGDEEKWLIAVEAARLVGFEKKHWSLRFQGIFPDDVERSLKTIATTGSCRRSCLLCGPVGVGKTALLSAMFKLHVLDRYCEKKYQHPWDIPAMAAIASELVTHSEIEEAVYAGYKDAEVELDIKALAKTELLMIDDLEVSTPGVQKRLDAVIDLRWGNGLSTWITSNLSRDDLSRRLGWERSTDRFSDKNWISCYALPGKSLRKEADRPGTATK
jgi:DNA replication protein DnaC